MPGRVLLVIDMLNDFINENGTLYCGPAAAGITGKVTQLAREFMLKNEPIVFIMDAHEPDDLEFNRFPAHCVKNTPGADIIEELKTCTNRYKKVYKIAKNRYSGFYRTNLDDLLREIAPEEIHVTGVCTNICVLYTVEELCNRDYRVIVHRDGVAGFNNEAHHWAIQQMESVLGAEIV